MQLRATLIVVCWIAWVLIWIAMAIVFRPDVRDSSRWRWRKPLRQLGFRLLLGICIVLTIRTHYLQNTSAGGGVGWAGLAVCVAGFGLAIWARVCLAQNWGHSSLSYVENARYDFGDKRIDWCLRLSPHYYNTEHEVDRVVELINNLPAPGPAGRALGADRDVIDR